VWPPQFTLTSIYVVFHPFAPFLSPPFTYASLEHLGPTLPPKFPCLNAVHSCMRPDLFGTVPQSCCQQRRRGRKDQRVGKCQGPLLALRSLDLLSCQKNKIEQSLDKRKKPCKERPGIDEITQSSSPVEHTTPLTPLFPAFPEIFLFPLKYDKETHNPQHDRL
jgi:hypothetical protein